jgi:NAD(P)-dependent dehydrogenase (short-subunit alcohol dehydrogenase family)
VSLVPLDLCDQRSVARARDEIAGEVAGRGLDVLINNAGLTVDGPLELVAREELARQFEVNVVGQIAVTQAFLPALRRGGGRVINIGGGAGRMALPLYGPLSASKAALDSLSDVLRMELKHQGVKVVYIEPGAVATDFFPRGAQAAERAGYAGTPDSRRIYAPAITAARESLAKSRQSPVDAVVRAMVRAATSRRPRARYVVGLEARYGAPLLRLLPTTVRDRVLMANLGLGADAFDTTTWR